ncbi:uncharacterized protein LOC132266268 [Cornus florida]|uniref:uncharacterized protein LOC132266268 n=1 Tax=Cornus florida TaxID=4283 RepID=UPI0028A088C3|nr:uncharacterized protein LOC132266268 [Cornus florida]
METGPGVQFTAASFSDHYGLDTNWYFDCSAGPKPFKFLKIWCVQEEIDKIVAQAWTSAGSGNAFHMLQQKLKAVKTAVKEWNKVKGTTSEQIQVPRDDLQKLQLDMLQNIPVSRESIDKEIEACGKLHNALAIEEILWAQKSRSKWLQEGDKCTAFFHNMVKKRRGFNAITHLQNTTGEQTAETKQGEIIEDTCPPRKMLTPTECISLDCSVTMEEVKDVVMQFHPDKAPRLDGLSIVLPSLIGPEQSAFIKNRRLHDNILLVSDLVKDFGKKTGGPSMALKTDRVQLCKMVAKTGMNISHAFYVDDLLMVVKDVISTAKNVDAIFKKFKAISGLQVNQEKSSIIYSTSVRGITRLSSILHFQTESFPYKYLSLPLSNNRLRSGDLRLLLDKINSRLAHWNTINLSLAGRIELIKSVLYSYLYHWMFGFKILWVVKYQLEKRFKWFLWSGKQDVKKLSQVKWSQVTLPVVEGGFNIRRIQDIDCATKMTLCWEFLGDSPIWKQILGVRQLIKDNSEFQIGDGLRFKLLTDPWCNNQSLIQQFGATRFRQIERNTMVSSIIHNGEWMFPVDFPEIACTAIQRLQLQAGTDTISWKHGRFSLKAAWSLCRLKKNRLFNGVLFAGVNADLK